MDAIVGNETHRQHLRSALEFMSGFGCLRPDDFNPLPTCLNDLGSWHSGFADDLLELFVGYFVNLGRVKIATSEKRHSRRF